MLFFTAYITIVPIKTFVYNLTRPPTAAELRANTQEIMDRLSKGFEDEGCGGGTISEMMKCSNEKMMEKINKQRRRWGNK